MPVREQPENEDPKAYLWEQRPSTSDGRGMDRVDVGGLVIAAWVVCLWGRPFFSHVNR